MRPIPTTLLEAQGCPAHGRKLAPLPASHQLIGTLCLACGQTFIAGEVTTLVVLGPGNDPQAREQLLAGRPYTAVASPAHWACATGGHDDD